MTIWSSSRFLGGKPLSHQRPERGAGLQITAIVRTWRVLSAFSVLHFPTVEQKEIKVCNSCVCKYTPEATLSHQSMTFVKLCKGEGLQASKHEFEGLWNFDDYYIPSTIAKELGIDNLWPGRGEELHALP